MEALDLLAESWGLPPPLVRIAHVVLAFGFFVTLVLAWYHGEQGRQRVSGPELLMVAALLLIAGVALTVVGDRAITRSAATTRRRSGSPTPPVPTGIRRRTSWRAPLTWGRETSRRHMKCFATSITELGWRGARWIRQSPVYERVRADSGFAAALAEQERLIARERREVERMLTAEAGT